MILPRPLDKYILVIGYHLGSRIIIFNVWDSIFLGTYRMVVYLLTKDTCIHWVGYQNPEPFIWLVLIKQSSGKHLEKAD